jgi:hypothetical protein
MGFYLQSYINILIVTNKNVLFFAELGGCGTEDNLTDTKYIINRGYEMPGITAMGGYKLKF